MSYWSRILTQRTVSRRRAMALAAGGLSGAALLAACGDEDDGGSSSSNSQTSNEAAERGGLVGDAGTPSASWNPVSDFFEATRNAGIFTYERLVSSRGDDRRFLLEGAKSIEVADPLKVVVKLIPGNKFQNLPPVNGRLMKAEDIVATQQYATALSNAYDRSFQQNFVSKVEATDDSTVVFTLKQPDAYLFSSTHLGNSTGQVILPKELLEVLDTHTPVGSGPYQLTSDFIFGSRYRLERNPNYHGASKNLPYIDQRELFMITDVVAIEAALLAGQIHNWYGPPSTAVDRLKAQSSDRFTVAKVPGFGWQGVGMNMDPGTRPWKDVRVREALYRLTNRQQIIDLVFQGKALANPGTISAGLTPYLLDAKETAQYYKMDLQQAKALLDAAGYDYSKEWILASSNSTQNATLNEVWQQQATAVGIKTRSSVQPSAPWLTRVAQGDYDLVANVFISVDSPGPHIRLSHTDQKNQFSHMGLRDATLDALIEKSEATTDFQENIKLVKTIQTESLKKYTSAFSILTPDYEEVYDSKLQDHEVNPLQRSVSMPRVSEWLKRRPA